MSKKNQPEVQDNDVSTMEFASSTGFDPSRVKVKKNITLPLLKMRPEVTYYLRIDQPIFKAKPVTTKAIKNGELVETNTKKMEPPELAEVTNLETGEKMQIIVPKVLGTELRENYVEDAYVGLSYSIVKHEKATGKDYATFSIAEIEY